MNSENVWLFFLEVLSGVSFDWKKILEKICIYSSVDKNWTCNSGGNVVWDLTYAFPLCQFINILDYFDLSKTSIQKLRFHFRNTQNLAMKLYVEDRERNIEKRPLKINAFNYFGSELELNNLETGSFLRGVISISQNIYTEEDKQKHCKNYPNNEFYNLSQCDGHFIYNYVKNNIGIIPFWTTDNLLEITPKRYFYRVHHIILNIFSVYNGPNLEDVYDGTLSSNCYMPCKTTQVW